VYDAWEDQLRVAKPLHINHIRGVVFFELRSNCMTAVVDSQNYAHAREVYSSDRESERDVSTCAAAHGV
jgi:hypothetical protein